MGAALAAQFCRMLHFGFSISLSPVQLWLKLARARRGDAAALAVHAYAVCIQSFDWEPRRAMNGCRSQYLSEIVRGLPKKLFKSYMLVHGL